jgi:hypothetical protein
MNLKSQEKTQPDLFCEAQEVDKKIKKKTRFFLPDIKNNFTISCETIVFFLIGFVMISIIAFSLGVEKGRYDERRRRVIIPQQITYDAHPQPKPSLKKGVSNVTTSKPKNIKSR